MLAWNVQETKGDRLRKVDGGMEWDLKEFAWESAELEQKEDSDLSAMVEFSSITTLEKQEKTSVAPIAERPTLLRLRLKIKTLWSVHC